MSPVKAIKAAYFSPSGGTKRAAMLLCEQFGLSVEYIDCTCPPAKLPTAIPVAKDELLVLALPVYGGFGPRVEGLFSQLRGQGGPCVILAAYGNRDYENALAAAARQMTEQGFVCVGGIAPITRTPPLWRKGAGRLRKCAPVPRRPARRCGRTPQTPAPHWAQPGQGPLQPLRALCACLPCRSAERAAGSGQHKMRQLPCVPFFLPDVCLAVRYQPDEGLVGGKLLCPPRGGVVRVKKEGPENISGPFPVLNRCGRTLR